MSPKSRSRERFRTGSLDHTAAVLGVGIAAANGALAHAIFRLEWMRGPLAPLVFRLRHDSLIRLWPGSPRPQRFAANGLPVSVGDRLKSRSLGPRTAQIRGPVMNDQKALIHQNESEH